MHGSIGTCDTKCHKYSLRTVGDNYLALVPVVHDTAVGNYKKCMALDFAKLHTYILSGNRSHYMFISADIYLGMSVCAEL